MDPWLGTEGLAERRVVWGTLDSAPAGPISRCPEMAQRKDQKSRRRPVIYRRIVQIF